MWSHVEGLGPEVIVQMWILKDHSDCREEKRWERLAWAWQGVQMGQACDFWENQ